MKIIADLDCNAVPPRLRLFIHGAPHRRMHRRIWDQYRAALIAACKNLGVRLPMRREIDLYVLFIEPTCPDMGGLYLTLETCLDGKNRPGVLADDSLIKHVDMGMLEWDRNR